MKRSIAVVFGGFSGERVISEKSARVVARFLPSAQYDVHLVDIDKDEWKLIDENHTWQVDKNTFTVNKGDELICFDGVFNAIHGTPGEDGKLQGYFDLIGIPYNNCGVLASAITFNKSACNRYLKASGVNVARSYIARLGDDFDESQILERVGLPCFVKPNDGGSSIGVTKVKHPEQLAEAIRRAQAEGVDALIESFLDGVEVSCGCISENGEPRALAVTEIVPANEFFDFDSKYLNKATQEITPARIDKDLYSEVMSLTEHVYHWLNCKGMIRVDYMLCNDGIYLIEVNTTPGLSEESIIPQQALHAGFELADFFDLSVREMFKTASKRLKKGG
ncbi:MAG: D-alanine--D-alanine ligase [Salibacteraceae bacterium]